MGAFDQNETKKFELAPEGFHVARLYAITDMGTHDNEYKGDVKLKHEVRFTFELPETKMEDGRPFAVSQNFTLSRSKKGGAYISKQSNLFSVLKKWLKLEEEKDIMFMNLNSLVGKEAELEIEHTKGRNDPSKTYPTIVSINKLRKGQTCPPAINKPAIYHTGLGVECPEFNALPEWQQKRIKDSYEIAGGLEKRIEYLNANKKPEAHEDSPF